MDTKGQQIKETISQIEKLINKLKALTSDNTLNISQEKKPAKKNNATGGPTGFINRLVENGFFSQPRSPSDVAQESRKSALSYDKVSISMALMRFVRKGLLVRDGQGTTKSPWVYKK